MWTFEVLFFFYDFRREMIFFMKSMERSRCPPKRGAGHCVARHSFESLD